MAKLVKKFQQQWSPLIPTQDDEGEGRMVTATRDKNGEITTQYNLPDLTITPTPHKLELRTFYPGIGNTYPFTGHSQVVLTSSNSPEMGLSPTWSGIQQGVGYLDMTGSDKGYNLVTNNCSNLTMDFINHVFGTNEQPMLFTTPGDVRDTLRQQEGQTEKRLQENIDQMREDNIQRAKQRRNDPLSRQRIKHNRKMIRKDERNGTANTIWLTQEQYNRAVDWMKQNQSRGGVHIRQVNE